MKKIFVLMSIIAIMLLVGCDKNEEVNNSNGNTNNEPIISAQVVSKLDDERNWIYDAEYERNVKAESYTTTFDETYYAKDIIVPYINIDSNDARIVNSDIKLIYDGLITSYNDGTEDLLTYIDTCEYKYSIHDDILSGYLTYSIGATDVPPIEYYTFDLDLKTGKKVSYKDVYTTLGFDDNTIDIMVCSAIAKEMNDKLDNNFGKDEISGYTSLSKGNYYTSLQENETRYFIDENGKLNVIVTLSIPAGRGFFDTIITVDNDENATKISFLDDIYGVYGDWNYDAVYVFPGKDDDHIDIGYFLIRTESFYINDVKITSRDNGVITAYKDVPANEINGKKELKLDVLIQNNKVKLSFDGNALIYGDENEKTILEGERDNTRAINEKQEFKALDLVKDSNGKYINNEVFEIVKNTENYLVVRIKCYLYADNDGGYYGIDGSDSIVMYNYYNFDKKNNRYVMLEDIIGDSYEELNNYIKNAIEDKKQGWKDGTDKQWNQDGYSTVGEEWPYQEFEGLGSIDYFDNYFLIDEESKTVKIRCLPYPSEAQKALGDICIDVPFEKLNNL